MKNSYSFVLAATTFTAITGNVIAADYSDDIHKNDYLWTQFNLMYAIGEKPNPKDNQKHDYLEMEFGGRSGIVELYGYIDIFNLTNSRSSDSDKNNGSKMFLKLAPRFSIDAMTGNDLTLGPFQEFYVATLFNWGGGEIGGVAGDQSQGDVNNSFWGLGSDVMVPWLGKVGVNLYGLYDLNSKDWNGYQVSTNWFKPFVNFENGSFIAYQGYIDYQFGMSTSGGNVSHGGTMFNGFYWHSERYLVGYGLKAYDHIYGVASSSVGSGFGHYFAVGYKF